jgi:hypothetical protein
MLDLAPLIAEIGRNRDLDASIIALVEAFAAKVEELKNDPVALQAAVDQFRADNDKLAAAVVKNTPAAPPA